MKKMELGVVTIMNLCMELRNKYDVEIKVRNYFRDNQPDPYFLFECEPSNEVMEFVREYFRKEGGSVIFADNGRTFIVCEEQEDLQ